MFSIGEKIFYPLHGGGHIAAIEEKELFGETKLYYILKLLLRNMQVMVPVGKDDQPGIRQIVNSEKLGNVLDTFYDGRTDTTITANQRSRMNMNKMKTGDISQGAEVIRDLARINSQKKLNATEKNMLDNALQLLISEVVLVKEISLDQATALVDQVVNNVTLPSPHA